MNVPGLCHCGCGEPTELATRTDQKRGHVEGQPLRYKRGHKGGLPQTWVEEDLGFGTPCWIWQGGRSGKYGWARGFRTFAHRVIWMKANGPVPEGMALHHLCPEYMCVRPDHLDLVTRSEHREIHQGDSGRRNRLTREQVYDIRTSPLSLRNIATKYGISKPYASKVRQGRAPLAFAVSPKELPKRSPTPHKSWNRGTTKLTPEAVRQIRESTDLLRVIAEEHGISIGYVWAIKRGHALSHL